MKHYYIRYPRNFANEYDLVWIESTDAANINEAINAGYDRITRKEAFRKVSCEKYARRVDQNFSGYGDIVILPYNATRLPAIPAWDSWECYVIPASDAYRLHLIYTCQSHDDIRASLYSDDGVVFSPSARA